MQSSTLSPLTAVSPQPTMQCFSSPRLSLPAKATRVIGLGHHQTTFQALEIAMGPSVLALSSYFERCRRQRNQVDYDMANVATDAEANLLVQKAQEFQHLVEHWIRRNYSAYAV